MKGRGTLMRLTILALLLAAATFAAEIPKGSHALLRMVNSVTTRTAREGDYVYLRTATPSSPTAPSSCPSIATYRAS